MNIEDIEFDIDELDEECCSEPTVESVPTESNKSVDTDQTVQTNTTSDKLSAKQGDKEKPKNLRSADKNTNSAENILTFGLKLKLAVSDAKLALISIIVLVPLCSLTQLKFDYYLIPYVTTYLVYLLMLSASDYYETKFCVGDTNDNLDTYWNRDVIAFITVVFSYAVDLIPLGVILALVNLVK